MILVIWQALPRQPTSRLLARIIFSASAMFWQNAKFFGKHPFFGTFFGKHPFFGKNHETSAKPTTPHTFRGTSHIETLLDTF